MKRRLISLAVLSLGVAVLLAGCGNDPDAFFKKGKYAEAYTEFVKRGGLNETALKTEVTNGSFDSRNKAGNQAIHDYYYAAESQKKLGNDAVAKGFYQKVADLGKYEIRVPQDKSVTLKNSYDSLLRSIDSFRNREKELYTKSQNTDPYGGSGGTDPYGGSGGSGGTDPYGGSGGSGGTDPYGGSGGSGGYGGSGGTDPYGGSGGSNTDPYSSGGRKPSGGSNTDPYAQAPADDDPWYRMYYNDVLNKRREFEKLLYGTTAAEVPDIDNLKREYDIMARNLDNYLRFAAPNGFLSSPNSLISEISYLGLQSSSRSFQRSLYGAKGNVTYITTPIRQTEPQLVTAAQAELNSGAPASTNVTQPSAPVKTTPATGVSQDKTDSF